MAEGAAFTLRRGTVIDMDIDEISEGYLEKVIGSGRRIRLDRLDEHPDRG